MNDTDWAILLFQAGFVDSEQAQFMCFSSLASKLDEVSRKLDDLQHSVKELTLKDIRAGFIAVRDAGATTHQQTRERCLEQAEWNFRQMLGIDPETDFNGHSAKDLLGWSHHGLSYITVLRGDLCSSAAHILESYVVAPRLARIEFTPSVYDRLFAPGCEPIIQKYERKKAEKVAEIRRWHKENKKAILGYAKPVGEFMDWVGLSGLKHLPEDGVKAIHDGVFTHPDQAAEMVADEVEKKKARKIDRFCREGAAELLSSRNSMENWPRG